MGCREAADTSHLFHVLCDILGAPSGKLSLHHNAPYLGLIRPWLRPPARVKSGFPGVQPRVLRGWGAHLTDSSLVLHALSLGSRDPARPGDRSRRGRGLAVWGAAPAGELSSFLAGPASSTTEVITT